jgi:hypothetical protein
VKQLLGAIHDTKSALRALAGSAGEAATEADENGDEEQAEELHKLAGWAATGAGKMRKLLDPEGANLLCEFLGQMPLNFPGETYPGERADNAPTPRSNGIDRVEVSYGDQHITLDGGLDSREFASALADRIDDKLGISR